MSVKCVLKRKRSSSFKLPKGIIIKKNNALVQNQGIHSIPSHLQLSFAKKVISFKKTKEKKTTEERYEEVSEDGKKLRKTWHRKERNPKPWSHGFQIGTELTVNCRDGNHNTLSRFL